MENSDAKLQALLQVDPSMMVRARIRLPVLPCIRSSCFVGAVIHALRCIDAFIHALHSFMCSFMCHIHSCVTHVLHLFMRRSCVVLASHSFMCRTHSCVALIHVSPSFMRYVVSLFTYQPRSLQPPWPVLLLDMYHVSDLLARVLRYDQDECASRCI